jgi:LacI family transcriptional regulator
MATIVDVAEHAGVSPTTVSRYLNNRIELPAATSARIDAAILRFDYRPNLLAKRLSTGRSEAVGLVVPEIREPFFAELASAVEDEAERHGYAIFMSSTRGDRRREIDCLNRLHDRHVDGLIMLTNTPDDGTLAAVIRTRRNVVLIDEDIPGVEVPRVFIANEPGAYAAAKHLIEAGHRDIAYLSGPVGLFSVEERSAGFRRATAEAGVAIRPELMHGGSFSPELARLAVLGMLDLDAPPTAIFASSDYLGIGALRALKQRNVGVPGKMSLVSFDDMPMTELFDPPLTSVRQPVEALGRQGFRALLALMEGREPPRLIRLPVELIKRRSVGAPRQGSL